jgi:hypothetical protein
MATCCAKQFSKKIWRLLRTSKRYLRSFLLLPATLLLLLPQPIPAALFDCTYNGGIDNWSTVSAWSACNSTFPNNNGDTFNATISTGTVTLDQAITIQNFTSSGSVQGNNNLTITGVATLSGGQMFGAGSTITQGPLTIDSSAIALDTGRILDVQGGATWNAGTIFLNWDNQGVAAAGTIINRAGSLFDNTFDGQMLTINFGPPDDGTSALFDNQGTFRKSGGTGTTFIQNAFNNSGTVQVQTGTLTFTDTLTQTAAHS